MLKRLSLFCICLIMFTILSVAFHHHDDGCDHEDCPVCSASLHHQPVDLAIPIQVIHLISARIEFFIPTTPDIVIAFSTPINSRAPPA